MTTDLDRQIENLQCMTVCQLVEHFQSVYGYPSHSRHKQHLVRAVAWGLQAGPEGGLSERALRRAAELVDPADLRLGSVTGSGKRRSVSGALPRRARLIPGTVLVRTYQGRAVQVRVLDDGFEYRQQRYRTLSAAVKAITGSHWNGYQFFDLPAR